MEVYCNQCGQAIVNGAAGHQDYLKVTKTWGYFSNRDLEIHEFNLCESCYEKLIKGFSKPIKSKNNNEAI